MDIWMRVGIHNIYHVLISVDIWINMYKYMAKNMVNRYIHIWSVFTHKCAGWVMSSEIYYPAMLAFWWRQRRANEERDQKWFLVWETESTCEQGTFSRWGARLNLFPCHGEGTNHCSPQRHPLHHTCATHLPCAPFHGVAAHHLLPHARPQIELGDAGGRNVNRREICEWERIPREGECEWTAKIY